ncbi:hypothetical protein TRFO_41839 [Tritrichomonas foetus]|uniref:Phosphatidic acid phosphatase type 2/haloperoxidase domain-containing protein n=1 Tax=Tritrichomonas foetus TaxID=1144522 RepID=A0A1J4L314_9EUKA|nr:hypothetical protein TRFO_41839 [Tritrichomonas foetus]|eukprot:OHT16342.1 hypothetical protein TRFO_41839 [Tritrichomonas foetus]
MKKILSQVISIWNYIDGNNFLAVIVSGIFLFIAENQNSNIIFISPQNPQADFPVKTDESLISYKYFNFLIAFIPLLTFLIIKIIQYFFPFKLKPFNVFSVIWIVSSAQILTLAISIYFQKFVGWFQPVFYSKCGYNTQFGSCRELKKSHDDPLSKEENLKYFNSYPSDKVSLAFCSAISIFFIFQKIIDVNFHIEAFLIIPVFFGIFVAAQNVSDHKNHPTDSTFGLFIGFFVSYYILKNKKVYRKDKDHPKERMFREVPQTVP